MSRYESVAVEGTRNYEQTQNRASMVSDKNSMCCHILLAVLAALMGPCSYTPDSGELKSMRRAAYVTQRRIIGREGAAA